MKMKLMTSIFLAGSLLGATTTTVSAEETNYVNKILNLHPELNTKELVATVGNLSTETGDLQEVIYEKIYKELKQDVAKGEKEELSRKAIANAKTKTIFKALGASGGTVVVGSSTKGNFYYTPSQTAYLDHGHVGMYYTSTTIVESVPSDGVRTIAASKRKVDSSGAVIKSVKTTTAKRNAAADWAYSQLGESYSYNFVTNRSTSHTGAKNCSKLIWSAYKLKAGLDLDVDGGLGVYPRDVRDAKDTTKVRDI